MIEKDTVFEIRENRNGKGIFVTRSFMKDEIVSTLKGELTKKASKYTIQIATDKHIMPVLFKYLNHGCLPNCYYDHEELVFKAKSEISVGEELVFDYNTTEYKMVSPFHCNCGASNCYGEVKGYFYLNLEQKTKLSAHIPEFFNLEYVGEK